MAGTRPRPCGRRGPSVDRDPSGLHWMSWSRVRRSILLTETRAREREGTRSRRKNSTTRKSRRRRRGPRPRARKFLSGILCLARSSASLLEKSRERPLTLGICGAAPIMMTC